MRSNAKAPGFIDTPRPDRDPCVESFDEMHLPVADNRSRRPLLMFLLCESCRPIGADGDAGLANRGQLPQFALPQMRQAIRSACGITRISLPCDRRADATIARSAYCDRSRKSM
jgi:hypothetical protein